MPPLPLTLRCREPGLKLLPGSRYTALWLAQIFLELYECSAVFFAVASLSAVHMEESIGSFHVIILHQL